MTDTQLATMGADALPAFMKDRQVSTTGLEDASNDKTTPRIQLAQAMSPQVKKKNADYIEGLEEGMFFNALTGEIYGESFTGNILKAYQSRALFTDDNTVDCYSQDNVHGSKHSPLCADCPLSQWKDGTPPACSSFDTFIILPTGAEAPAVMGIKKSNKFAVTEARNLNTHLALHAHMGAYAADYTFTSKVVSNGKNEWYVITGHPTGYVQDEGKYETLAAMAEQFKDVNKMEERT